MNNTYIKEKEEKEIIKNAKQNYLFGMIFGFSIIIMAGYSFLNMKFNCISVVLMIIVFYGIFLVLTATINPYKKILSNIRNINILIFNNVGILILKFFLSIVYLIFIVPVGIYMRKNKDSINNTTFIKYDDKLVNNKYKFLKIFKLFASEYLYMLPLIIVLLVISILVVTLSSNVIAPLIYTLF